MSNSFDGGLAGESFCTLLSNYIGKTVTIFTKSGGQSGSGFTGVVLSVNEHFVRLITRIGPAPGCALGNSCTGVGGVGTGACLPGFGSNVFGSSFGNSFSNGNGSPIFTVGSVTDIPIDAIASFVHDAI
jgi:hypothetical protein